MHRPRPPFRPGLGLALLVLGGPAAAQQAAPTSAEARAAEVKDLDAMLARTDAALAALRPVLHPPVTFAQYDARAILCRPGDRAAPSLSIPADAAGFRTARGAKGAVSEGTLVSGGTFSFDSADEPAGPFGPDQLEELVRAAVGGDEAWAEPCALEVHRQWLLVRQTAVGHARIRRVLTDLAARAQRGVQLEVGFYGLSPALQQDLEQAALAAQGVLAPEALARLDQAVAGGTAKLASSAVLSAIDGQRIFLHQGQERAYVGAFELSSGGTGQVVATVAGPVVAVLRSGLTLDVRPTLLVLGDDARVVALDVRFARSRPLEVTRRPTTWGPIETPQVTTDAVRTSAQVPAGAGMLVFSARGTADDGTSDVAIVVRPRLVE